MTALPHPLKTDRAREVLAGPRNALPAALRMLLISVDGRRSESALRELALSLGLPREALDRLVAEGLVRLHHEAVREEAPAPTPQPVVRALAPAAPLDVALPEAAPAPADFDLRRLVKAKMFALDLVGRMLAGRDGDLRASAREVDSESTFLAWLDDASARIAAAANDDRARFFRERVAEAIQA